MINKELSYKTPNMLHYILMAIITIHAIHFYGWVYGITLYLIYCISIKYIISRLIITITNSLDDLINSVSKTNQHIDIIHLNVKINILMIRSIVVYFIFIAIIYFALSINNYHELIDIIAIILSFIIESIFSNKCKQLIMSQFIF